MAKKKKKGGYTREGVHIVSAFTAIGKHINVGYPSSIKQSVLIETYLQYCKLNALASKAETIEAIIEWFVQREPEALVGVIGIDRPVPKRGRKSHQRQVPLIAATGAPSQSEKDNFYRSWEWRTLRMQVLKKHGRSCLCCGASAGDLGMDGSPVRIVVDHIKPLAKRWDLRLDPKNLQVLCDECNQGKGAWDQTDYREIA